MKKNKQLEQKGITLNSYIAQAGIASRRKSVELIENGRVMVNGKIEKNSAYRVQPDDIIAYRGKPVKPEVKWYILLNKPKGYISTVSDEKNRKTVMDLIDIPGSPRLYPIGRLDRATTGIILLTNDGDFAAKLSHPRYKIEKIYKATLDKKASPVDIKSIAEGIQLEDGFIKADYINYGDETGKSVIMALHSGKNMIVRRIFAHFNYEVVKLDRFNYAGLTKKGLSQGQWRFLTDNEVNKLKNL